jgi:translation initiation factor 1 (eIF-1/SUI1)
MTVFPLNVAYLHQHWEEVAKYLNPALELSGVEEFTLEQMKVYILNGSWTLFVVVEEEKLCGAVVVAFSNYPNDRVAFVTAIGGKFISSKETFEKFKVALKNMGATKIQGGARESVARLWNRLGFKNKQILVEYKL